MRRLIPLLFTSVFLTAPAHAEQDLLLGADMGSAAMTKPVSDVSTCGTD
ncbi:hypothetical protein [Methylobacterium goesingense]|uniref:Uncharacterized protein n=1 Tax=Methylobacterium goesingense TaxID=243690 RepID=A0ABV2LCM4_9HYPH